MVLLEPTSAALSIPYPSRMTEFEVQAMLMCQLRQAGLDVRGEVKAKFVKRRLCRFDLVVYEREQAVLVIEVKRPGRNVTPAIANTLQASRYRQYGVPVRFVAGWPAAVQLITDLTKKAA